MKRLTEVLKSLPRATAVVVAVLLLANSVTLVLLLVRAQGKNPTQEYPLIDIARAYIPQEHFIVNIQPLREELLKTSSEFGNDNVSIYFEFLNTGANIQINNDLRFYPASLVKLPTAMVVMRKVEKGEWNMDSRLVLYEQDKDSRYGQLYQQTTGSSYTVEQLLKYLLIDSDNTAHKILMRNLTEAELNELRDDIGLNDLFNEKNEVSAKEYSRMFRALYISSFLKRDGSQKILNWLSQTKFSGNLADGLPTNTIFSHKIGEDTLENNYLDSGIVYLPNRPYLITVMTKGKDQAAASNLMKKVSKAAYDYIHGYK